MILGERIMCTTSADIDLCPACMGRYGRWGGKVKMNAAEGCKDHEFIKVPSEGCHRLIEGTGNERVESEDE